MADITMCEGGDCNMKENCYRHKAPVNEWRQAYFMQIPVVTNPDGDQQCAEFVENYIKKEKKRG